MLAVHALLGLSVLFLQTAQPRFRAVPLESMGGTSDWAFDINERGEAVGRVITAVGLGTAVWWDSAGHLKVLGQVASDASANAINDDGIVVGGGGLRTQLTPLVWTLPSGGSSLPFPQPATAVDVNASGGKLLVIPSGLLFQSALMRRDGEFSYVLRGQRQCVRGLAEDGRVTGSRQSGGVWLAFRWSELGGVEDLELPSTALQGDGFGISPDGKTVVGRISDGIDKWPVCWNSLGHLEFLPAPVHFSRDGLATAVNSSGWIVGSSVFHDQSGSDSYAVLWTDGTAYEIDDLIVEGPRVHVLHAFGINDKGQIVGHGELHTGPIAVRLDPL